MPVSVSIVRCVVLQLAPLGVSPEQLCQQAGLSPTAIVDPSAMVSSAEFMRVLRAADRMSGGQALGLAVGRTPPTAFLHVVGHALVSCRTARDAYNLFHRLSRVVVPRPMQQLSEQDGLATLRFHAPDADPVTQRFTAEAFAAANVTLARMLIGNHRRPESLSFAHAQPADTSPYGSFFGCPVEFGAEHNELVFPAEYLDMEQPFVDSRLHRLLERQAEDALANTPTAPLEAKVGAMLRHQIHTDELDERQVAHRLGMKEARLRQALRVRGVSLRKLVNDARLNFAREALAQPDVSVTEVSQRLGFSEPSAFHRAFKRWTGVTPGEYRREQVCRAS